MTISQKDRAIGALIGLAVGDALGTTLEFRGRDTYDHITDMVGGGPFNLPVGGWTDDTSMALCLGASIQARGWDLRDQLIKYSDWRGNGYMSHNGRCFDIGGATSGALSRFVYLDGKEVYCGSTNEHSAGNGSIMRLAPVPIAYWSNPTIAAEKSVESSKTTHQAPQCLDACAYMGALLAYLIGGDSVGEYRKDKDAIFSLPNVSLTRPEIIGISHGSYIGKDREDIRSSGYVVHTLEAALWAFYTTNTFRDGALLAVNLGDDADSVGAVYGQIAGAFYGVDGIPEGWRQKVLWADKIEEMAGGLFARGKNDV